jgi:hypothetical protein
MRGAKRLLKAATNIHNFLLFTPLGDRNAASAGYREQRDSLSQFCQLIALCSRVGNDRAIDENGR